MQEQTTDIAPRQSHPAIAELETYREKGANLLLPTISIEFLSEFHVPVVEKCYLSSNKDDGDVYPANYDDDCNVFRLTAQALLRISMAAGIIWHPTYCKRIDDRKDRNYVAYQAMGGIKRSDGKHIWFKRSHDIDIEVEEEEAYERYRNKCKNWKKSEDIKQGYIESSVRRDILQKRKHKLKMVETGAMTRVVRSILSLKNQYTKAELQNPFIAVRIVLQPDYSNEDVRAAVQRAAIESTINIYGGAEPKMIEHQDALPPVNDEDIIDLPTIPEEEPDPTPPENGQEPSDLELFLDGENAVRIRHLEDLAKKKQVDLRKIVTMSWGDFNEQNFINLFNHLTSLPDLEVEEDIPF